MKYKYLILFKILWVAHSAVAAGGEAIYKAKCSSCYDSGAGLAPRVTMREDWSARQARGRAAIYESALKGMPATAMAAKGGYAERTDDEVRQTVDDMLAPAARIELYASEATLRGINIRVGANQGVVTLSGALEKADVIPRANAIAQAVPGVRQVQNRLIAAGMLDFD